MRILAYISAALGGSAGAVAAAFPYLRGSARLQAGMAELVLIFLAVVLGFFITRAKAFEHQWSNRVLALVYGLQVAGIVVGGVTCLAYFAHEIGLAASSLLATLALFLSSEVVWRSRRRTRQPAQS